MKTIGIILTSDEEKWKGEKGLGDYFLQRFMKNNDGDICYETFHAVSGYLPKVEDFKKFSGFVISGSAYSVNDNFQWIHNLKVFILQLNDLPADDRPKLFGICFGHQLIAITLGGKVQDLKSKKFIFGSEKVTLKKEFSEKEYFANVFGTEANSFTIMQCHGEEVSILPTTALSVGESVTCAHEVLKYGNWILSTQGHPEFTPAQMKEICVPNLRKKKILSKADIDAAVKSFENADTDRMVQMVKIFLTC